MKTKFRTLLVGLALLSTINSQLSTALAQSTAFTYQGQLVQSGMPYNGPAEMQFTLFNTPSGGVAMATNTPTVASINVSNGLFTVALDFGAAAFPGAERWLEIQARTGLGAFITLTPRQALTPTPYAIYASKAMMLDGTLPASQLVGTYSSALTFNNAANVFNGAFNGSGAGLTGLNASELTSGSVPDARLAANVARANQVWLLGGNAGTTAGTHFLGTTDNQPLEIKVSGLRALRLEPNTNGAPNLIGGSPRNFVGAGVVGATVAGGGATSYLGLSLTNSIQSDFGVVGGGFANTIAANSRSTTIAGGNGNGIGTNSFFSAIGGGSGNHIVDNARTATIAGGGANDIGNNSDNSAIGGGLLNFIADNAQAATIPGGSQNAVGTGASYAFAAGRRAKANHTGAFVWADSTDADFASTAVNQFIIRAGNGVGIGTSNPQYPLDVAGWVRFSNVGDGAEILNLSIERSWAFRQLGSGASTALELASIGGGGNKNFVINTTGFVGIGTTAPGFNLHVNGTAGKPGGGSWSAASDKRLKKNIRPLAGALNKLLALQGVSFEYIDPAQIHELPGERMGLVAQEVEKVFPDWVETGADSYKRVTVRGLEALVVEALRELQQQKDADVRGLNQKFTEELKRRDADNAELKQQNFNFEKRLAELERLVDSLTERVSGGVR
jgi:hypothetical protein